MKPLARLRSVFDFSTQIARVPRSSTSLRVVTFVIATLALAIDAWMIDSIRHASYSSRAIPAAVALMFMWIACRRDRGSVGLILRPVQGWRWWCKVSLIIACLVGVLVAAMVGVLSLTGNFHPVRLAPEDAGRHLMHACVWAPIVEEAIYRGVLVVPLAAVLRPVWVVWIAGAIFAGLHVLYGNPAPANQIGGLFMTWAYLKSGSLAIPLLYHAGGNLFVIGTQLLAFEIF